MQLVLLCSVVGGILLSAVTAHNLLFLGLGEKCKNETEPWTCKKASTCQSLKDGIAKDGELKLCGFQGREPIICCPPELLSNKVDPLPSAQPRAGKKAAQKCREYAEYVYRVIDSPSLKPNAKPTKIPDCAVTAETLIVGGTPAKRKEFPHMALIGIENKGNPVWFCGGSLISPNFVLTAAHCGISNEKDLVVVRLGELDLLEKKDKSSRIDVKIAEVFNHPMYVPSKGYHDITLLKLEKEVELGPEIRPLCLQTNRSIKHDKVIASGWGYTTSGKDSVSSNILQKVLLNVTDDDKCVSAYGTDFDKVNQGIKPDIMMCSGGVRGKDTCKGDSGGPLQVAVKDPYCMYSQVGVTSFGINCGTTYPGVYTRVSAYVPWIENIVWP
ncbi:venom protease [Halyomorpha halys]|uniref:venom protease n=1 Tax=Halyomorpha halys TaxID=286706 RepID=UPI0006D4E217|nr:venom protease [Halyomorpha halys]